MLSLFFNTLKYSFKNICQSVKNILFAFIINKWDINAELSDQIYSEAEEEKMEVIGKIQYDSTFTKAQVEGVSVLEFSKSTVATEIQHLWNQVISRLKSEDFSIS